MTTMLSTWREPGRIALEAAWKVRLEGADLLTAIETGLATCELNPNLVAVGLGSLTNTDGELELDAAIMDGRDLRAGAVCALRGIVPAISVARKVMEKTRHIMIAGDQARRFAIAQGFTPRNLMTAKNIEEYERWKKDPDIYDKEYLHAVYEHTGDTVTMLGRDEDGHMVAGSATSGLAYKMPGRVGDSPIVGAGIYADDEVGCAGATGLGEELWKAAASFRTVENMRQGMSAQEACDATVAQMLRRQPHSTDKPCVVLAIRKDGDYGAATTAEEFPLWICQNGELEMRMIPSPA